MSNYTFSAERQLMFYVTINGVQRLVKFGSRNANGASVFITSLRSTAEAIREHSLFKRGVIVEQNPVVEEPEKKPEPVTDPVVQMFIPPKAAVREDVTEEPEEPTEIPEDEVTNHADESEIIKAKNFTQAKSLLSKKLGINYKDIKTPDQMMKLAKDNGIIIKYS